LTDEKRRPTLRDILRLGRALKLVCSISPVWTAASVGLTVLQGVLPLATVWFLKLIVDGVTDGITGPDQGRIIESGTHEELVALGGRYAEMYEVQAQAYQSGGGD
jgi:hypothetical protein